LSELLEDHDMFIEHEGATHISIGLAVSNASFVHALINKYTWRM